VTAAVTAAVLTEIGGAELPRVLVFNKCGLLGPGEEDARRAERPESWFTAAHEPDRITTLHARIGRWFTERDPEFEIFVPWSRSSLMGQVHGGTTVVSETFEDEGVRYRIRASQAAYEKLLAAAEETD